MIGLQSTGRAEGSLGCCVKERHVELPNNELWSEAAEWGRSSAGSSLHGLSRGGGASQGMAPAASRASEQGLDTEEAPHGRHSPAGVPGGSH